MGSSPLNAMGVHIRCNAREASFQDMGDTLARELGPLVCSFIIVTLPAFVVIREEDVVIIVIAAVYTAATVAAEHGMIFR